MKRDITVNRFTLASKISSRRRALYILQNISSHFPEMTNEYSGLFNFYKDDVSNSLIGLGSLLDITGHVTENRLTLSLSDGQRMMAESQSVIDQDCKAPYDLVFDSMHHFVEKAKSLLISEYGAWINDVPFLGGWKCAFGGDDTENLIRFTMPRVVIKLAGDKCEVSGYRSDVNKISYELLADYMESAVTLSSAPDIVSNNPHPDCMEYIDKLVGVMQEMGDECEKVVLSRKRELTFKNPVNPLQILHRVQAEQSKTYDIYMNWRDIGSWIGVSPETLVTKDGENIVVEPLAGTRKGSDYIEQVDKYREELKEDKKENVEHETAADLFLSALQHLCKEGSVNHEESKKILDLGYVQHLKSRITGVVKEHTSIFSVLSKIYPPATIWGFPLNSSARIIEKFEPFSREFFTGAFGYFNLKDAADFSLAIRVAKIEDDKASVFAGSGIVQGTDPYHEWVETNNKMAPFTKNSEHVRS